MQRHSFVYRCDLSNNNQTLESFLDEVNQNPFEKMVYIQNFSQIYSVPSLLFMDKLVYLVCTNCSLESLPELPLSIQVLQCENNRLHSLPDNFSKLTSMHFLSCGNNPLTRLPPLPPHLRTLICDGCCLRTLPELPKSLTCLYASHCQLEGTLHVPTTIRRLICSDNLITHIVSGKCNLQWLDCSNNLLKELDFYPSAHFINCSNNKIQRIGFFPRCLMELDCSGNQLTFLPKFNNNPQKFLRRLMCENNPLVHLPPCHQLHTLHFCNTPLHDAFQICNRHPSQFKTWNDHLIKHRFRIMCLKYRTVFRKLLWDKVRRPKIEQRFHYRHLLKILDTVGEDGDDEPAIQEWIQE